MNVIPLGKTVPLDFLITANGQGITGQTPVVALKRASDNAYWTGSGFSGTFTTVSLSEVSITHEPGLYSVNFDQSIDNVENTYVAYYVNGGVTAPGSAVEEFFFTETAAQGLNPISLASAVAAKILLNPAIKINSADIASQTTLLAVQATVNDIDANMATQASLTSLTNSFNTFATTVLGILQPVTGSNQVQFILTDQNIDPVPGVAITLKNTSNQITLAYGVTDINGKLTFGLPAGTFNVLFYKPFVTFPTQPYSLVVTTNMTVPISVTTFQPTAPSPDLCACFAYIQDAVGQPVEGASVRAKLVVNFPYSPAANTLVGKSYVETTTDASGYFELDLIKGATYEIVAPEIYYGLTNFVIPNQANLDLSTVVNKTS